jgi:hypothetical protein
MAGRCRGVVCLSSAVLSMAVLLAGCAADPGRVSSADSSIVGPQAGSRAKAEAFDSLLLHRLAFPPGTQPAHLSHLPPVLKDPWAGSGESAPPGSVDLGQLDTVNLGSAATEGFLLRHSPSGAGSAGRGQENGPSGVIVRFLYFHPSSLPQGIDDAEIVILLVPQGAAATLIGAYVHVIWYPSRTAAEYLNTADFGSVSIRAIFLNPRPHEIKRTFRSPADIGKLAGLLNGLPAAPNAAISCPSASVSYQITFKTRTVGKADVVVTTDGCYAATVTSNGIPQPALLDIRNALPATAGRMLGLPSAPTR